jgi:hypothetical protein
MPYRRTFQVRSPFSDLPIGITVVGTPASAVSPQRRPDVWTHFAIGDVTLDLGMSPADARALASNLAIAAIVAERGDAELIPFSLPQGAAEPQEV